LRISKPHIVEHFGNLAITSPVKTLSLTSVSSRGEGFSLTLDDLLGVAEKTAIVIPVKNEELFTLNNTLRAIPEWSPVVVVSASSLQSPNNYGKEVEIARSVHEQTGRSVVVIHQRDPAWTPLLEGSPLKDMIGSDGVVKYGKGEGMVLGVLTSKWLRAEYVGFIDSDNYIPGAVYEYSLLYYAGFKCMKHEYSMVRIVWSHKGKLTGSLEAGEEKSLTDALLKAFTRVLRPSEYHEKQVVLRRKGRVSQVVEDILNYALSLARGVGTDIVKTPNSGEHALSLKLALSMKWAGGFAVETYELVNLFEECFIARGQSWCGELRGGVKILQAETINPHIHGEKGDEHLAGMLAESLGAVYYSKLCNPAVARRIREVLKLYARGLEPVKPRIYSLHGIAAEKIVEEYLSTSKLAEVFE